MNYGRQGDSMTYYSDCATPYIIKRHKRDIICIPTSPSKLTLESLRTP